MGADALTSPLLETVALACERDWRMLFERLDLRLLGAAGCGTFPAPLARAAENPERIGKCRGPAVVRVLETPGGRGIRVDAHGPGRTVTQRRRALIGSDVGVLHAGKVVVGLVVLAHVVEAEIVIFALALAPLRRAIAAELATAVPFTGRRGGFGRLLVGPADADAVEIL